MSWHIRFEEEVRRRHPGAGIWYTRISRQPGWVTRTALGVAVLVVVVPVVLLTLAAVVIGVICFTALSLAASIWRFISSPFGRTHTPSDDGRRNVEVIDRP
jgi:hypothetical protein